MAPEAATVGCWRCRINFVNDGKTHCRFCGEILRTGIVPSKEGKTAFLQDIGPIPPAEEEEDLTERRGWDG